MHPFRPLLLVALMALLVAGCRKDERFTDSPSARLEMSRDTVLFDTIFTTVGSVTKRFTVHNRNSEAVRVDIALEGGSPSPFRINVDGASGLTFDDVEILGGDSIFIFVEATLGTGGVNTPFLIEDHILFNTNGNAQQVLLQAWGQDAHFYPNPDSPTQHVNGFPAFSYIAGGFDENGNQICETVHWTNDKPYVISGYAVVDECCKLIIDPGTRVYFHGGGGLWVYLDGQLQALGTPEAHITFQGDRLEPLYADLPGQWERIWITEGNNSTNDNIFTHCDIKNALVGIQCETAPWLPQEPTSTATLQLTDVSIRNCSAAGILSRNHPITATNLLVADAGQYAVALTGGGEYHFNHATIANYWDFAIRQDPGFILTNYVTLADGSVQVRDVVNSTFTNGIIYGTNTNEFAVDINSLGQGQYTFDHYLFRTDQSTSGEHFPSDIYRNQEPGFINPSGGDFHLSPTGGAVNRGILTSDPSAFFDLDGNQRGEGDGTPDLGCYEHL